MWVGVVLPTSKNEFMPQVLPSCHLFIRFMAEARTMAIAPLENELEEAVGGGMFTENECATIQDLWELIFRQ